MGKNRYAGAYWVARHTKKPMSEFGKLVADILGQAFLGIYHIERRLRNVDWSDDRYIRVPYHGGLATTDGNELTRLVLLAHDSCVRFEIEPCNMQYVYLTFTPRKRAESMMENHPTMEEHVAKIRGYLWTDEMPFKEDE